MNNDLTAHLNKRLRDREAQGLQRSLKTATGVDFTSNDYLGLARSNALAEAIQQKLLSLPQPHNGATGSRLLSGNTAYAEAVEAKLATIFQGEAALVCNSGYAANLAVFSSIAQRNDTILYDALAHACIKDGARLSQAKTLSFRHNDLHDLEAKLKKATGRKYIGVESVYSMDGDACPLADLVALAERYNAAIIVDEAHSTGVTGAGGSGMVTALGLQHHVDVRIHTFGKAMGIHGACVVGTRPLRNYLVNFARPFIYTTALPPHSWASIECAFDFLADNIVLQQTLGQRIDRYIEKVGHTGSIVPSNSAIQTLLVPGNENVRRVASALQETGFDIRPILYPTVPQGTERLRICLHTFNTDADIDRLADALKKHLHEPMPTAYFAP